MAAFDAYKLARTAAEEDAGLPEARALADRRGKEYSEIEVAIADATAFTLEGLAVKARYADRELELDVVVDETLTRGLIRDLLAIADRGSPVLVDRASQPVAASNRVYEPEWEGLPDPWGVLKVDVAPLSTRDLHALNRVAEGLADAAAALSNGPDTHQAGEYTAAGALAFWTMEMGGWLIDQVRNEAFRRLADDSAGTREHRPLIEMVARYVAETGDPKRMRAVFLAEYPEARAHG